MKYSRLLVAISVATLFYTCAQAEVYPKESLLKIDKSEVAGGKGTLFGAYAFTRDGALENQAIKEVSWITLQPGDSVGYHAATYEDAYIIVSGHGIFKDEDGKDYPVKAGDITVVRKGQSHGIANTGKEPLLFADVIAEK
jgi:mannose-6-phosphate isomerase-like protein (cupin superfamily)